MCQETNDKRTTCNPVNGGVCEKLFGTLLMGRARRRPYKTLLMGSTHKENELCETLLIGRAH